MALTIMDSEEWHHWLVQELTDVASKRNSELCSQADRVSVMETKLEQGIERMKAVEEAIVAAACTQTENITARVSQSS